MFLLVWFAKYEEGNGKINVECKTGKMKENEESQDTNGKRVANTMAATGE